MAREDKLMIRMNAEVKENFQAECETLGVTMSAMASLLIGQWTKQQKQQAQALTGILEKALAESVKDGTEKALKLLKAE